MKKLTSFTAHVTAEGQRISFTYSEIEGSGNLKSQNNRENFIVMDPVLMRYIEAINTYIEENKLGDD